MQTWLSILGLLLLGSICAPIVWFVINPPREKVDDANDREAQCIGYCDLSAGYREGDIPQ